MIANNIQKNSILDASNIVNAEPLKVEDNKIKTESKTTSKEDSKSFDKILKNVSKETKDISSEDTVLRSVELEKNVSSINKEEISPINNEAISPIEAASIMLSTLASTIINESKEGSSKNESLINKLVAEFSLDKTKVEQVLNNNLKNETMALNNPKAFVENFLKELGLKDENLSKAYKMMFEIMAKASQKNTIKNSTNNFNSEEILLYKDYQSKNVNEYKEPVLNIKDAKNVKEDKLNNAKVILINNQNEEPKEFKKTLEVNKQEQTELKSLDKNIKSENFESKQDGERKNDSNTDINFAQSLNKVEAKNINSVNINEKLDAKILNDTVVQNVKILSDKNGGSFEIDLKTLNLGKLNLKVETDANNKVSINLVCNNLETKKLIESNLSELKSSLSNLNIKTDSINVVLNKNLNMEFENNKKEELAYQQSKNESFRDSNSRRNNKEERKDN